MRWMLRGDICSFKICVVAEGGRIVHYFDQMAMSNGILGDVIRVWL
jgi:flagella basal body P-ring formation protein FlgA